MAIDRKYALEYGTIGGDELVVVFRARDVLLPKVLKYYILFCLKAGSPRRHINILLNTITVIEE